ncbi:alpha/beta hydrolase [Candidatus Uhrbacteria bacterium]|nr:alpha/beta hydrolase [Candidatus Uhrbacteria bacterium]
MSERITFQTSDGVNIVGTFIAPVNARRCVLLLHMMPADRSSWQELQNRLEDKGMASLAIDLRGHGESEGDQEFQAESEKDVEAALVWLEEKGFLHGQLAMVGASIGANLALQAVANHRDIPKVVLLSPGENYHGVKTFEYAKRLRHEQAALIAASAVDDEEPFQAARKIEELMPGDHIVFKMFEHAGHGTNLFKTHPHLIKEVAEWVCAP